MRLYLAFFASLPASLFTGVTMSYNLPLLLLCLPHILFFSISVFFFRYFIKHYKLESHES